MDEKFTQIRSLERDVLFFSPEPALSTMYAELGRHFRRYVFELMDKSDVVTWNPTIFGFTHLEIGDAALKCFVTVDWS